jgi:mannose-6-phosphate isomerase-like protein (cupin superfamily)
MPDLAEKSLSGRDNVKVVPVGCSGLTSARLIVLRDSLPSASYVDADESLYLVAGEATMTIESKAQALTAGWFAMLPRGTNFEVVRKGRNPVIFLSLLNGRPCTEAAAAPHE